MDWLLALPPVTRSYFVGCVVMTALVHFDVVSPLYLYDARLQHRVRRGRTVDSPFPSFLTLFSPSVGQVSQL